MAPVPAARHPGGGGVMGEIIPFPRPIRARSRLAECLEEVFREDARGDVYLALTRLYQGHVSPNPFPDDDGPRAA